MLFHLGGRAYDLGSPAGFLGFPMSLRDKAGFVRLMLKAFNKRDWSDWQDRSAADLVDSYAGPGARVALFERLTQLKFELPCSEVSGAWLGARLHFREGSRPFGYIPGANWTKVLCDGVARLLADEGVTVRLNTTVSRLVTGGRSRARSRAEHRRADRWRRLRQHDPDRAVPPAAPRRPHARDRADPVLRPDLRRLRHASAGGRRGRTGSTWPRSTGRPAASFC